ncbi:MAG: hypothetical protein S4CHLAM81_15470 [Chlamydiales bacterium]|nr:hypothetical protein [Chlamydiales bacterium]MCH9636316.1 hypothetical protein [Chlamydiales bacterium]MCH9703750.1 LysM peptidoglycan-binding domain-containing protein [Chlamydiota bacterium]
MTSWKQQVLVLSLILNVALLALFSFFVLREGRLFLPYKPAVPSYSCQIQELDEEGVQQFVQSSEFTLVQTLFARSGEKISKGTLLKLLMEGNQHALDLFVQRQQRGSDFSDRARQEFLMEYVSLGSKTAAYLMIMVDLDYALLLSNPEVEHLLDLMDEATPEAISFTEEILEEKRTPLVHQRALGRLSEYTGKSIEELAARYDQYQNNENLRPLFRQQVPITQDQRTHIVQPGESLWIIAKRYKVDMKKLMVTNDLKSTVLRPGQMLKIPFPEG